MVAQNENPKLKCEVLKLKHYSEFLRGIRTIILNDNSKFMICFREQLDYLLSNFRMYFKNLEAY